MGVKRREDEGVKRRDEKGGRRRKEDRKVDGGVGRMRHRNW